MPFVAIEAPLTPGSATLTTTAAASFVLPRWSALQNRVKEQPRGASCWAYSCDTGRAVPESFMASSQSGLYSPLIGTFIQTTADLSANEELFHNSFGVAPFDTVTIAVLQSHQGAEEE